MPVQNLKSKVSQGFTLIELLIVIAILGVLAVVVLVAINPVEQLAKTRDSGRISTVTQLGHALEAYYTSRNATYPAEATWSTDLTASGELSVIPSGIAYTAYGTAACGSTTIANGTWCYELDATNGVIVYATMESNSQNSKCTTAGQSAFAVFSTADGRGGVVCAAGTTLTPWAAGGMTYY